MREISRVLRLIVPAEPNSTNFLNFSLALLIYHQHSEETLTNKAISLLEIHSYPIFVLQNEPHSSIFGAELLSASARMVGLEFNADVRNIINFYAHFQGIKGFLNHFSVLIGNFGAHVGFCVCRMCHECTVLQR